MLFSSSFYTTVVSNGLHEPYLLLANRSIILILSDFGSNLSEFRSKFLKASLMSLTLSLFSDKVHCFNQLERALYGNFIISNGNRTEWSPIQSVIIRVITKSDDHAVGVRFVYHEYDYRLNWTTRSPIIN